MKRIINHWTAGSYTASSEDRKHYHFLIEGDGTIIPGKNSIAANAGPLKSGAYAAHTRNCNTKSIGLAVCCMVGAKETPFDPGLFPILSEQWRALVELNATLAAFYKIPVTPQTILTHAEVEKNLGITQRGQWDITAVPEGHGFTETGVIRIPAIMAGETFRADVKQQLDKINMPEPTLLPKAWIKSPDGSTFLLPAGWTWEKAE
jgi:hypothetical protein